MNFEAINNHINESIHNSASEKFKLDELREDREKLIGMYRKLRLNQRAVGMDENSEKAKEQIAPLLEAMAQTSEDIGETRDNGGFAVDRAKILEGRLNRLDEIDAMNKDEFKETEEGKEFFEILDEYIKVSEEYTESNTEWNFPQYEKTKEKLQELKARLSDIETKTVPGANFAETRNRVEELRKKIDLRLREEKDPNWEEGETHKKSE